MNMEILRFFAVISGSNVRKASAEADLTFAYLHLYNVFEKVDNKWEIYILSILQKKKYCS